jgi:hypothetical protein
MTPTTYSGLVEFFVRYINLFITFVLAILFIYFVWKMISSWVLHGGDPNKRDEGKKYAITATIVFVVMVSLWGIVGIIRQSIFGF